MSNTVISVRNLGKKYRLGATLSPDTLRDHIMHAFDRIRKRNKPERKLSGDFWALEDVSFDVMQGEVMGVIGPNGAGKSTLLKILTGITEPTKGEVRIKGRVASLLEVGTGFHLELSGRENIFMNGAILGMTQREIKAKFDEIVDFAGVEKFLDTPVKRYSSGMRVRLGFAVAAHLEPEILLVDEVLAVGDVVFQDRCLGKMNEVAHSGRTVLFVSHNMGAIGRLCRRSLVLDSGCKVFDGETSAAIRRYLSGESEDDGSSALIAMQRPNFETTEPYRITYVELFGRDGLPLKLIATGDYVCLRIHFTLATGLQQPSIGLRFFSGERYVLARIITYACGFRMPGIEAGNWYIDCVIERFPFCKGEIIIDIDLVRDGREQLHLVENALRIQVQGGDFYGSGIHFSQSHKHGYYVLQHEWRMPAAAQKELVQKS